jgi:hypothetical protein
MIARVSSSRRRRWPWIVAAGFVVLLGLTAIVAIPILTHVDQGQAHQDPSTEEWPLVATSTGDDGRDRRLEVIAPEPGIVVDTAALHPGDYLVVSGSGYDASRGIYIAVCAIPDDPSINPGPCLGGVPEQDAQEVAEGTIQYAPSNWINDDWAWRLVGARSYDDQAAGTFTAYLEIPEASDDNVDCRAVACAIYTRNDHTAAGERVQDLFIPIAFAG